MARSSLARRVGFITMRSLSPGALPGFIGSAPIVVIYVRPRAVGLGNQTLLRSLASRYGRAISFGVIAREALGPTSPLHTFFGEALQAIGLPPRVLPGYYLFVLGNLRAWHPGTFDKKNARVAATVSIGLGFVQLLAGRPLGHTAYSSWQMYESGPAAAAFGFFSRVIDEVLWASPGRRAQGRRAQGRQERTGRRTRHAEQEQVFRTTLRRAYAVLGVAETATDEEIKRRRKVLLREHHPDRVQRPREKARCEEMVKQIGSAYEIIVAHRGL